MTGPAKIDYLSAKDHWFVLPLFDHNLLSIDINVTKSTTTTEFYGLSSVILQKWDPTSTMEGISKI